MHLMVLPSGLQYAMRSLMLLVMQVRSFYHNAGLLLLLLPLPLFDIKVLVVSEMTLESIPVQSLWLVFHIRCCSMVFIISECAVFLNIVCSSY